MHKHIWVCLLSIAIASGSCGQKKTVKEISQPETVQVTVHRGTQQMAAMLKHLADTANPEYFIFQNSQRAALIRQHMQSATEAQKFDMQGPLAMELLNAGKTGEAIQEFESLLRFAETNRLSVPEHFYHMLGVAYLRIGEQQNCCANHTAESCIIPIRGQGIHKLKEGSLSAIEFYKKVLKMKPGNLETKWLLNLAYMTLGWHPDSVPTQYFIPVKDSDQETNFPHFNDIAPDLGLDANGLAGGVCMEDFNNDGHLDIMCSSMGIRDQLRLFQNNGDGTFKEITVQAGLDGLTGGLNINHADYNNDGWQDVLVLRGGWMQAVGGHPNSLLKNNGDGTFEDVTASAGILSFHPTQAASWGDFNNDGCLDLFIGNESTIGLAPHPCELYMNNKNGTFTEVAAKLKLDFVAYVKGVAWGDINNDGLPDLYCSNLGAKNKLFLNKGGTSIHDWKFEDISNASGTTEPKYSFPCWFFDFNNDGWQDIFVSGYSIYSKNSIAFSAANEYLGNMPDTGAATPHIFLNNKNNTFTDVTRQTGFSKRVCFTMGCNFGDLDNDGWTDFYLATGNPDYRSIVPNRMFRNVEGKYFNEVTFGGGFGHIQKGHGVAFGDLDHDGDQDIYTVMGGAVEGDVFHNVLFENPGFGKYWITLILEGTGCNKNCIGARIKISVTDAKNKERNIYSVCSTGGSFGSESLQQEIGLGDAVKINFAEIIFPDGKNIPVEYKNLEMNKFYKITQGTDIPVEVKRKKFEFRRNNNFGAG